MASANIATKPQKKSGLVETFLKYAWVALGASFTFQTGAVAFHDETARTPEDALRDMGYKPELLTKPLSHDVNIRLVEDSWPGKIRLYNRLHALTLHEKHPSVSTEGWEYAAALMPKRPDTLSSFHNQFQGTMAALRAENPRQTALILMGSISDARELSLLKMKDGKTYSVFDFEDSRDLKALALLHEWEHASTLGVEKDFTANAVHASEISADLYSVAATKELTGKDYTQKMVDVRILRAFHGLFSTHKSDYTHDTALALHYSQTGRTVSQAEIKKAHVQITQGCVALRKAGYRESTNPEGIYGTADTLRYNLHMIGGDEGLSPRERQIVLDTLNLLASAAWRLVEKGPEPENGHRHKFILSQNPALR
jgi:hypothetical protein